jgi:hypothetical protein
VGDGIAGRDMGRQDGLRSCSIDEVRLFGASSSRRYTT